MSEVIKPENECQFDPKQYECHGVIAPVGSFSWALIQLKLRKLVARSVWRDKKMYLAITPRVNDLTVEEGSAYAVDGVAVGTKYDYLTHIDLRNEHGNFVPWQPTQEDMMACDWNFVEKEAKPEPKLGDNMFVFDLTLGTGRYRSSGSSTDDWGYLSDDRYLEAGKEAAFGVLNVIQNKTTIEKIEIFCWVENNESQRSILVWRVASHGNDESYQQMQDLFRNKSLYIRVDGITSNLGMRSPDSSDGKYYCDNWYEHNTEAQKLSEILKQTGRNKRFDCNWR
ncbi:DUF2829 domain-containing protein [Photorhabdus africana]|uniref:DUF2829 domain-containing protein n=1 Tax=Photorhabdus africana TaxID=3097554 RepID=UPI002B400B20|nr:DUF2829 domain-containing protein [Photorhabdus sp. CRI-LC]